MATEQTNASHGFYRFARAVAHVMVHTVFPVKAHDADALRSLKGPCILICNHKSALDPIILGHLCKNTELRFLGKAELTKVPVIRRLVSRLGMIAIRRGEADLQGMRACSRALKNGEVLAVFPEGTRHLPDLMSTVETGVALLTLREKVPVVPVYVHGKLRFLHRTHVFAGQEIPLKDLREQGCSADSAREVCARIRSVYLDMRERADAMGLKARS